MRHFIIFIILLGSFGIASAQSKFAGGPVAGLNFSKFVSEADNVSATARPFFGLYGQYRAADYFSVDLSGAYSMRGERYDKKVTRREGNFIDTRLLLRVHFLKSFSFGAGIGYYHFLNARYASGLGGNSSNKLDIKNPEDLSRRVVPLELGFQFQNEATLHFAYDIGLSDGFNNTAVTFRFPIRFGSKSNKPLRRRAVAENHIKRLEKGALLVRLPSARPLINALNERGYTEKMEEVVDEVESENRKIVEAFGKEYDFSEVYFFYSHKSREIREGNFSPLMNADFETVSAIMSDSIPDYYIAEFTTLRPDTGHYYIGTSVEPNPNGGQHLVKKYGGYSIGADFQVLVIKDKNFIQLRDPFPYYKRGYEKKLNPAPESLIRPFPFPSDSSSKYAYSVKKMNSELKWFRKRVEVKEERKSGKD